MTRAPAGRYTRRSRYLLRAAWVGACLAVTAAWLGLPLWGGVVMVVVIGGLALGAA